MAMLNNQRVYMLTLLILKKNAHNPMPMLHIDAYEWDIYKIRTSIVYHIINCSDILWSIDYNDKY